MQNIGITTIIVIGFLLALAIVELFRFMIGKLVNGNEKTTKLYLRGERFTKSASGERERLGLFVEETGEALQIVGKIERFGIENFHPNDPNTSNRELLEKEIGDVLYAVELLIEAGDVSERTVSIRKKEKLRTRPYFPYNKPRVERGTDGSEREGGSGSGRVSTNEPGARDQSTGETR